MPEKSIVRLMTPGEIAMAQRVFGHSISYHRVWIHCDSYFPFGLQNQNVAMSPNGEIYFREKWYRRDFSDITITPEEKHTFIHELGHVWQHQHQHQHQHGQWVRMRGLFSWAADYDYDLNKDNLLQYSLEQQASIIADYWMLIVYGLQSWRFIQHPGRGGHYRGKQNIKTIPDLYKKIVHARAY